MTDSPHPVRSCQPAPRPAKPLGKTVRKTLHVIRIPLHPLGKAKDAAQFALEAGIVSVPAHECHVDRGLQIQAAAKTAGQKVFLGLQADGIRGVGP